HIHPIHHDIPNILSKTMSQSSHPSHPSHSSQIFFSDNCPNRSNHPIHHSITNIYPKNPVPTVPINPSNSSIAKSQIFFSKTLSQPSQPFYSSQSQLPSSKKPSLPSQPSQTRFSS